MPFSISCPLWTAVSYRFGDISTCIAHLTFRSPAVHVTTTKLRIAALWKSRKSNWVPYFHDIWFIEVSNTWNGLQSHRRSSYPHVTAENIVPFTFNDYIRRTIFEISVPAIHCICFHIYSASLAVYMRGGFRII